MDLAYLPVNRVLMIRLPNILLQWRKWGQGCSGAGIGLRWLPETVPCRDKR